MTDRELMQQALEALTAYDGTNGVSKRKRVLAALREALARQEPEPVAWMWGEVPLYTAPREWVGLTDEELFDLWMKSPAETEDRFAFVKAALAKQKERNT